MARLIAMLRIALVAEGPTDYEAIQAALKAVLPQPFVMIQLQPEATGGMMGTGWCGVLKWMQAAQQWYAVCSGRASSRSQINPSPGAPLMACVGP